MVDSLSMLVLFADDDTPVESSFSIGCSWGRQMTRMTRRVKALKLRASLCFFGRDCQDLARLVSAGPAEP